MMLLFSPQTSSKCLMAFGILLFACLGYHGAKQSREGMIAISKTFASGLFTGVALCHMLPHILRHINMTSLPYAALACLISFALMWIFTQTERTTALLFALVLAFHSFFAGISAGVTLHEWVMISLFVGLAVHKLMVSYAFSTWLHSHVKQGVKRLCYFGLFALSTPLGIVLGNSMLLHWQQYTFIETIGLCFAFGTLLYLGIEPLVNNDLSDPRPSRLSCITSFTTGFVLMALVAIIA